MRVARVFPSRTGFVPTDSDSYFDVPGLFVPVYDEVHVSCVFTWDVARAKELAIAWGDKASKVLVGGPAFDDHGAEFIPGRYVRGGVVITSRGCPNSCPWCLVSKREGKLRELEVKPGNVVQDNNVLACSPGHIERLFSMLQGQRQIEFKGGLEASRVTPEMADRLRGLHIKTLWLACDTPAALNGFKRAAATLTRAGFTQSHIRCYVLIGDDMSENQARLAQVYEAGAMPFAQLYQPPERREYSVEWKQFARKWSRPAIIRSMMSPQKADTGSGQTTIGALQNTTQQA